MILDLGICVFILSQSSLSYQDDWLIGEPNSGSNGVSERSLDM
jgi:hypothetical protein